MSSTQTPSGSGESKARNSCFELWPNLRRTLPEGNLLEKAYEIRNLQDEIVLLLPREKDTGAVHQRHVSKTIVDSGQKQASPQPQLRAPIEIEAALHRQSPGPPVKQTIDGWLSAPAVPFEEMMAGGNGEGKWPVTS